MFERFTSNARSAVVLAQEQARTMRHDHIGAEHLLLGVMTMPDTVGARVLGRLGVDINAVRPQVEGLAWQDAEALRALGIDMDEVRRRAEETLGAGALDRPGPPRTRIGSRRRSRGTVPFHPSAKAALVQSLREAVHLSHDYIGTEHLLLGLLADEHGPARLVLQRLGVTAS